MNDELRNKADECYSVAEQKALQYFRTLHEYVQEDSYVSVLTDDFRYWSKNHIQRRSLFSFLLPKKSKPNSKDYHHYIQWLNYTGKLERYLDRSISYIYLRDLGRALDELKTQERVQQAVSDLKKHLTEATGERDKEVFSMAGLYKWAEKQGVEDTLIWLMDKLETVSAHIPEGMDAEQAQRKLIKIIAGVVMHVLEEEIPQEERTRKLEEAIRLGYSYGLTYPFIDDLQDANILTEKEQKQFSELIRSSLLTQSVPEQYKWPDKNGELLRYIHAELREAFEYIKMKLHPDMREKFFEQSYVFFQSQEVDRLKELSKADYTNEELFVPIILKSACSRLIVRSVISADEDEGFENRTFYYGIYNQLADDFTDMFDDIEAGAVTPYTYYLKYRNQRRDLINPFELYWTVISNLIHHVYHSDPNVCEVILDRAINSLKRCKERLGTEKYNEIMDIFASGHHSFNKMIQHLVDKADDVDFFDKLLRDYMLTMMREERKEQEEFSEIIKSVRAEINTFLPISLNSKDLEEPVIEAANYSLTCAGKRLRPIITWVMGVNGYGLEKSAIMPVLKSLEYMHTASLIYDDLPSQDNALTRRGNTTLHHVYNTAVAEITALFLTQKAIEEQTLLTEFDAKTVLNLIQYSTRSVMDMCRGQVMDLESKGKMLTVEQLNSMCFYKTGIAFEVSLLMPAILAHAEEPELKALKKFARHAGIAFQIKDDLLDVEGSLQSLGKPTGQDQANRSSTFVSVLGKSAARKEMWHHYCRAIEALQDVPRNTAFLKHLMNYILNRDH